MDDLYTTLNATNIAERPPNTTEIGNGVRINQRRRPNYRLENLPDVGGNRSLPDTVYLNTTLNITNISERAPNTTIIWNGISINRRRRPNNRFADLPELGGNRILTNMDDLNTTLNTTNIAERPLNTNGHRLRMCVPRRRRQNNRFRNLPYVGGNRNLPNTDDLNTTSNAIIIAERPPNTNGFGNGTNILQSINETNGLFSANDDESNNVNINDEFDIVFLDDTVDSSDKHVYNEGTFCEICFSKYDKKKHKPVILPCGHVLCLKCIKLISEKKQYRIMECPMDRIQHSIAVTIASKTVIEERNVESRRHVTDPWDYYRMIDHRFENISWLHIIDGQIPDYNSDEVSVSEYFERYGTIPE